jgi:regulator of CtrA degradation
VSEPDIMFKDDADPIHFGRTFVHSDAFKALFQEGMELVEETAAYLDGPGREESRELSRQGTLTYASESMRLTTRLMQVASWLLVQRAVAEGEITSDQAQAEKTRVRLGSGQATPVPEFELLPNRLKELIGFSARLHARILHLDQLIADGVQAPPAPVENAVAAQHSMLQSLFAPKG